SGCVQAVHDVCDAFCNVPSGTCAHDECFAGAALASGCSTCATNICALRPTCCTGTWDANCTAMVGTTPGCAACGQCRSEAGVKDPACNGADLYMEVPCSNIQNL